jgi:hypothetical protein
MRTFFSLTVILLAFAPTLCAAAPLKITLESDRFGLYTVKKGAIYCIDRTYKLAKVPPGFEGLTAVQTRMSRKTGMEIGFTVNQPVRVYAVFFSARGIKPKEWGRIPEGWKRYWLDFWRNENGMSWNIHYKDFPAGKNTLKAACGYITLGVRPLDALSEHEQIVPDVRPCIVVDHFRPHNELVFSVGMRNFSSKETAVALKWVLRDTGNREVAKGQGVYKVPVTGSGSSISAGKLKHGLYFIEAEFSWGKDSARSIRYPFFIEPVHSALKPSQKGHIGIFPDVRQFDFQQDWDVTETRLHAVIHTLRSHGIRSMYANLSERELGIAHKHGMRVIMDARRYPSEKVLKHPALYAWFGSKAITRKDLASFKKSQDELAATIFKDRPYVQKPMSHVASKLASNRDNLNPLLVWRFLQPKIRTLRCTPWSGEFNALRPNTRSGGMSYDTLFRIAETSMATPWWFMASVYGEQVERKADAKGKRKPSGPELSAICHLALANGARNLFTYRSIENMDEGIIHKDTLAPLGTSLQGLKAVSEFLAKTSAILVKTKPGVLRVTCDRLDIVARPRMIPKKIPEHYLYVINLNDEKTVTTTLTIAPYLQRKPRKEMAFSAAQDVATREQLSLITDKAQRRLTLSLKPGEGKLIALTLE